MKHEQPSMENIVQCSIFCKMFDALRVGTGGESLNGNGLLYKE